MSMKTCMQKVIAVLFMLSVLLILAGIIGLVAADDGTDLAKRSHAVFMLGAYIATFYWGTELGRWVYQEKEGSNHGSD